MPRHVTPGNPLWLGWVEELASTAEEAGLKSANTYKKAARAFRSCPISFKHPDEALQLSGVGPKIGGIILSKLKEHCTKTGEIFPDRRAANIRSRTEQAAKTQRAVEGCNEVTALELDNVEETLHLKTAGAPSQASHADYSTLVMASKPCPRLEVGPAALTWITLPKPSTAVSATTSHTKSYLEGPSGGNNTMLRSGARTYVPQRGSGAYAILLALYATCTECLPQNPMLKADIIALGQPYSSKSFSYTSSSHSGRGPGFLTAWNGMKTLLEKQLVVTDNKRPMRYALSEAGYKLAQGLAPIPSIPIHTLASNEDFPSQGMPDRSKVTHDRDLTSQGYLTMQKCVTVEENADLEIDRPFLYFYLNANDKRVLRREDAEVGQEDETLKSVYRIEYQAVQELHPMARCLIRPAPLDRAISNNSMKSRSGYIRARVSNKTCPGFLDEPCGDKSSGSSLMNTSAHIEHVASAAVTAQTRGQPLHEMENDRANSLAVYPQQVNTRRDNFDIITEATIFPNTIGKGSSDDQVDSASAQKALGHSDSYTAVSDDCVTGKWLPQNDVQIVPTSLTDDFKASFTSKSLRAGTFKIVLIVDSREIATSKQNRSEIVDRLKDVGVEVDRKMLPLGDMIWVARKVDVNGKRKSGADDVVLDAIVERKRLDDLCSSITDGRYMAQKGIMQRQIVNCKRDRKQATADLLPFKLAADARFGKQIWTAKSQLQVSDGFYVHETANIASTITFLEQRTMIMREMYEHTDLHVISDDLIDRPSYISLQQHLRSSQPHINYLITYNAFENLNKIDAALTLRTQFAMMIQRISGVSVEKAGQFLEKWPTPMQFYEDAEMYRIATETENTKMALVSNMASKVRKRKAEDFVVEMLGVETGSRSIKSKLGARIYHLFQLENYTE